MKLGTLKPQIAMLPTQGPATAINPSSWRDGLTTDERGYTYAWQKARAAYLRKHPLCVMCDAEGITKLAQVVDHKVAHRGDKALFWDSTNWQALCLHHHNSHAQQRDNQANRL